MKSLVFVSCLLALFWGSPGATAKNERPPMLSENSHPPTFTLPDTAGRSVSLRALLGEQRIVLVFIPREESDAGRAYLKSVAAHHAQFVERDLVVLAFTSVGGPITTEHFGSPVHVLTDPHIAREYGAATAQITFYLIGKDGTVKMARRGLPTLAELFATIDAMPMRQQERRKRHHGAT